MVNHEKATGKIILSGEYAVVYGYPGIAIPANIGIEATFTEDLSRSDLEISWHGIAGGQEWDTYLEQIISLCNQQNNHLFGKLEIVNHLPLGKGMGSSTALVIAVTRCLLGPDCEEVAMAIEDEVNQGHSGLDFAVIWHNRPVLFRKTSAPEFVDLPEVNFVLVDTGTPNESTPELISSIDTAMQNKDPAMSEALETIGQCTEKWNQPNPDIISIVRKHHEAQCRIGIVPFAVQELIKKIVQDGGAAKIIGAGSHTGGGGMVLALHPDPAILQKTIDESPFEIFKS
ncbi:MAG: hypothetical protein O2904_01005 [bacterium]|nr:hypothetical protein [bacterium]